jgi:hypothetical protein
VVAVIVGDGETQSEACQEAEHHKVYCPPSNQLKSSARHDFGCLSWMGYDEKPCFLVSRVL